MKKRLNDQEVEAIIGKIRKKYNDLIISFMLDPVIKTNFEKRLLQVRKAGVNPERFFNDEIINIKTIEEGEKNKINRQAEKNRRISRGKNDEAKKEKKDFADRMIEKIMKQIENYPEIFIHENANPEIRKLFGTLIDFDSRYWTNYDRITKKYRAIKYDLSYVKLENSINDFSRIYKDDVPSRLIRYKSMLSSPFSRTKDIEKEEKLSIFEAAMLINSLQNALADIDDLDGILTDDKESIFEMKKYLEKIKNDFRLKDLIQFSR